MKKRQNSTQTPNKSATPPIPKKTIWPPCLIRLSGWLGATTDGEASTHSGSFYSQQQQRLSPPGAGVSSWPTRRRRWKGNPQTDNDDDPDKNPTSSLIVVVIRVLGSTLDWLLGTPPSSLYTWKRKLLLGVRVREVWMTLSLLRLHLERRFRRRRSSEC